ncbi:MAG TPA: hypothetical protein VFT39_09915 [Vicinamibacterales bacterium]|nr:hypothetical protein [Vicinamibacterales bacterium]
MNRRLPVYGWFGLVVMVVSQIGVLARVEPFYHWHTPIAWTGYILLADALVWKRRGNSWLNDNRAELLFVACASVPLWVVFELYNRYSIHNWYYVGLPENRVVRDFGYIWSFATITPAIFETAEIVASYRSRRRSEALRHPPTPQRLGAAAWSAVMAGFVMVVIPMVVHSTYLAAPIWLGFIFLLDPVNARTGGESILGDLRERRPGRLINLMSSGLICGVIWEFWNYWTGTKWIYNVPILPELKIFEMPILGFGGFPPFAVECFVMYVAVRRFLWRGASRPIGL